MTDEHTMKTLDLYYIIKIYKKSSKLCAFARLAQMSGSFKVKTGVRQRSLLSPFLFLLVVDWVMKTTTEGRNNGIQWTLATKLDDLDLANNLALLSLNRNQMQDKTTNLAKTSAVTGLRVNKTKAALMKISTIAHMPVTVDREPIKEVESFVYPGSV